MKAVIGRLPELEKHVVHPSLMQRELGHPAGCETDCTNGVGFHSLRMYTDEIHGDRVGKTPKIVTKRALTLASSRK